MTALGTREVSEEMFAGTAPPSQERHEEYESLQKSGVHLTEGKGPAREGDSACSCDPNVGNTDVVDAPKARRWRIDNSYEGKRLNTVLGRWLGTVTRVGPETFFATLDDVMGSVDREPSIEAEFSFSDVREEDRELVYPGASFYWTQGREMRGRTVRGYAEIRFRRLPRVTKADIHASYELANKWIAALGLTDDSE